MIAEIKGTVIPAITALTDEGEFDEVSQRRLVNYLDANKVSGIFGLDVTGEFPYLSRDLKFEVMEVSADAVNKINAGGKKLALVLGVNGRTSKETVELTKRASSLDIDGIVLQPSLVPDAGYPKILDSVLDASGVPVYLYTNPGTAIDSREVVTPENITEAVEKGVAGLKVSDKFESLKAYCEATSGSHFGIFIGSNMDVFRAFGGEIESDNMPRGVVSGPGNVYPADWVWAWWLKEGDYDLTRQRILELVTDFRDYYYKLPGGKHNVATFKYLLFKKGIIASPYHADPKYSLTREGMDYLSDWIEMEKKGRLNQI